MTQSEGSNCASLDSVTLDVTNIVQTGAVRYRVATGSGVMVFDAKQYDLTFRTFVRTALVLFHNPGRHYSSEQCCVYGTERLKCCIRYSVICRAM